MVPDFIKIAKLLGALCTDSYANQPTREQEELLNAVAAMQVGFSNAKLTDGSYKYMTTAGQEKRVGGGIGLIRAACGNVSGSQLQIA